MGDIKPKRKSTPLSGPGPHANSVQDSALGEAPGESVVMPEIPGWNAEAPEPTPPPKGYFPPVDLIRAWQQATAPPPPPAGAAGASAGAEAGEGAHFPISNRLLITLTALGVLVVAGLGATYYLFFRSEAPAPQPAAVATPRSTPSPSPRPTRTPFRPTPAPAAPPPGPRTYTVVPGDTLITIGERLGVDWRQIAAANGQITDPNLILPGQVLKIP